MGTARLIRSLSMSLMQRDFVKAAQYMGIPPRRIVWRHLVPNIGSLLVLEVTRGVTGAILAEVAFSFIGIGIKVPDVSLGVLIGQATSQVSTFPWMFWAPLIVMFLLTGSLAMMNDGLRDVFDPSSSSVGQRQGRGAHKEEEQMSSDTTAPATAQSTAERLHVAGLHAPTDAVLSRPDLNVRFNTENGVVHAVRGVDFDLLPGKTLGIVGESGSGKSVTSLADHGPAARRRRKSPVPSGCKGKELLGLSDKAMCRLPRQRPRHGVPGPAVLPDPGLYGRHQIIEALTVHNPRHEQAGQGGARRRTLGLGRHPQPEGPAQGLPARVLRRHAPARDDRHRDRQQPAGAHRRRADDGARRHHPGAGAGGAAHRAGGDRRRVVMITHDLGVVAGMADDIMVMYAGKPVETGSGRRHLLQPADALHDGPAGCGARAWTQAEKSSLVPIEGIPPNLTHLPPGCSFAPRCPLASDACLGERSSAGRSRAVAAAAWNPWAQRRRASRARPSRDVDVHDFFAAPAVPVPASTDFPAASARLSWSSATCKKHFPLMKGALIKRRIGTVKAVDGLSFDIREGECFSIVGESGCGKTTTLLEIMEFRKDQDGEVMIGGLSNKEAADARTKSAMRKELQMVFQDPTGALDPRFTVYEVLAEPLENQEWPSRPSGNGSWS